MKARHVANANLVNECTGNLVESDHLKSIS